MIYFTERRKGYNNVSDKKMTSKAKFLLEHVIFPFIALHLLLVYCVEIKYRYALKYFHNAHMMIWYK